MDHDIYFGYQRPQPTEYVKFANFDSRELNLFLTSRTASNPPVKEVSESISYMDGAIDFSDILGRRIFDNRTLEYQFTALGLKYNERKLLEQKCKRLLLIPMRQPIYDSHDLPCYWLGKASSISITDDSANKTLQLTVQFNVSPYALRKGQFDDIWDNFSLETG
ncbi:phage tail protein, partial [Lactiplantibacillus plantarum]|uniref:phage tail protein n=1 Tax=Lactiplantibacillus plantarum TaxID=1590 RepID=UPI0030AEDD0A